MGVLSWDPLDCIRMHEVQSEHLREVGSLLNADGGPMLEVKIFGRLQIRCADRSISTFPTRKVEELLAYLLLNQGVPQSRDKLIEVLWPGGPADSGRSRLSTTLWRIRVLLKNLDIPPERYLQAGSESVTFLAVGKTLIDVNLFHHFVGAAVDAPQDEKESLLFAAQALCAGDLLEGIYSDWCQIERERLARLLLRTLGQLVNCLVERGAYEEAIDTCHKILEIDPLREEVHRTLMVCCGYLGRRCDGIRQFQRCANLLLTELGVFPLPETIEVYRSLTIAAADECIEKAEPPNQERLKKTFAEFMILGDELIELIDETQRAKRL